MYCMTGGSTCSEVSSSNFEHQERERDVRYTRASIIMVVMFFFCHAPRLVTNMAEIFMDTADMPPVSIGYSNNFLLMGDLGVRVVTIS